MSEIFAMCLFDFMLYNLHLRQSATSPFSTVAVGGFCCCFFVGFCLDEDCNPGGGDCGRPLRLFGYVEDGDKVIYIVLWRLGYRPDSAWSKKQSVCKRFSV